MKQGSHLTGVSMNSNNLGKRVLPKWFVLMAILAVTVTVVASGPKGGGSAPKASAPKASAPKAAPSKPAAASHSAPANRGGSTGQRPGSASSASRGPGNSAN